MGHAIAFDTHLYVKKLKAAGFTEEQAEILASTQAELIDERLATKQDIASIQYDIKALETSLKRDIQELEMRITIRLGVMMAASIAIVAALVKLL